MKVKKRNAIEISTARILLFSCYTTLIPTLACQKHLLKSAFSLNCLDLEALVIENCVRGNMYVAYLANIVQWSLEKSSIWLVGHALL